MPTLRTTLRHRRRALTPAQQTQAAAALTAHLTTLPSLLSAKTISLYLAQDGEIDPANLLAWCQTQNKRCFAPIIPKQGRALHFAEITPQAIWHPNHFGIPEPTNTPTITARELDLALLPLVAFDPHGNRLGMGGGYYDATFAYKKTNPDHPPQLIGIAHDLQRVANITAQSWDIPLNAVATDQRIYNCTTQTKPASTPCNTG